jgi:CHAT domain-containing protein
LQLDQRDFEAAVLSARQARALFAERKLVVPRCQAELAWARGLLGLGQLDRAESIVREVLAVCAEFDLSWLTHEGHYLLATIWRVRRESTAALVEYRAAIRSIERIQSQIATGLRHHFLGDKARVFHDAIELCLERGETNLAFALLERAKSRALVDYLAGNLDVRPPSPYEATRGLLDELTQLRAEHNWLHDQVHGRESLRRAELGAPTIGRGEDLAAALRDCEKRIAQVVERLDLRRTDTGERDKSPVDDGDSPLPALADETVLIEYFFGPTAATAFVIAGSRVVAIPLSTSERQIQRLLYQWQLNLDATAAICLGQNRRAPVDGLGRNAIGILQALHRLLIEPVADVLDRRARLVVVPFSVTHAVPFQVLHDGKRFLAERFEIGVCPSSELLRHCSARRREGAPRALVVGHSDGGRLPAVVDEARAVASLFPGECYVEAEATRARIAEAAGRHRLVHLAAHGDSRLDNPTFAHLKLADGQLNTVDVFGLDLNGAVVTLSACETGRGVVVGSDELIGLSRSFLYAGAATLVQSMWRVEDGSTAELMSRYYRSLRDGQSKGVALRGAQLAMLDGGAPHPYFWGAFQMIGDSGPL